MSSGRDEMLAKGSTTYEQEKHKHALGVKNTGGLAADNLTVRDYFAAEALKMLNPMNGLDYNAAVAFNYADAMMRRRALDTQGEL